MFAASRETYAALDGGFACRDEYFPSVHYIVGTRFLRLLCGRLGLKPPRRLKEETAVPAYEALEAELDEQRQTDWAGLKAGLDNLDRLLDPF